MAWKVAVEDLKGGFDLDVKNPHREAEATEKTLSEITEDLDKSFARSHTLLRQIKAQLP